MTESPGDCSHPVNLLGFKCPLIGFAVFLQRAGESVGTVAAPCSFPSLPAFTPVTESVTVSGVKFAE